MKQMLMGLHLVVENHRALFCLLNLRACHWHLHCSRSQETCSFGGTPPATSMSVLENVRRTRSIILPESQRVQPGVYTAGVGMLLSSGRVGSKPPCIPTAGAAHSYCYQVVLLPLCDFSEWPPVA